MVHPNTAEALKHLEAQGLLGGETSEPEPEPTEPQADADNSGQSQPDEGANSDPSTGSTLQELDVHQFGEQIVYVTVDGERIPVKLNEAIKGFQLQSDYQRKTAAIAKQRRDIETQQQQNEQAVRLFEYMQADPAGFVQTVSEKYGLANSQASDYGDPYDDDPYGQGDPNPQGTSQSDPRLVALEQKIDQLAGYVVDQAAKESFATICEDYGLDQTDDFRNEVIDHMRSRSIGDMRTAVKDIVFDRQLEMKRLQPSQETRIEKKLQTLSSETGNTGAGNSQQTDTPPAKKGSFSERKAKRKAVLDFWKESGIG